MRLGGSLRRSRGQGRRPGAIGSRLTLFRDPQILLLMALLIILFFWAGFLVSTRLVFPAPPPPGDLTRVPNLSGEHLPDLSRVLSEAELVLGEVDSLRHPTIPQGVVLGQSPLPGQLSLVGNAVRVAVSMGAEERPVPDVMRLRADRAQIVLEATGFEVVVDSVESEIPRGSVVAMDPEAGTEATIPQEIFLTVSMGPPMVEMPLLLGLEEEQAMAIADSMGLVVAEVETRFRFGRDQGLVVEQEPPATTLVERGAAIRLVVGRRGG
jgi:beta-lactam-binding protein with PASTA domain